MPDASDKTTLRGETRKEPVGPPRASLVLYHRDGAKAAPLVEGTSVVVGRQHPADVVLADPSLSRKHARFFSEGGAWFVEDLGSTNGTRIGGRRIDGPTRIAPGDGVTLGDVVASLHVFSPAEEDLAGIEGHERLLGAIADEITRARTFGRSFALAMVRGEGERAHVRHWSSTLRAALRPVDRVGAYSEGSVLVLLPEIDRARAEQVLAQASVRFGVVTYPGDGASAEELVDAARRALRRRPDARASEPPPSGTQLVLGEAMRAVFETIERVASSVLPVLVLGETGTGKEVIARAIHQASPRKKGPLRSVNCAAIPSTLLEGTLFGHEKGAFTGADRAVKGVFEQASSGTVFLDEIGELSPPAQAALLRVLETKRLTRIGGDREIEVDVRVVAATHRDLESMCQAGSFRWDLLYRLNAVTVALPPLRDRPGDVRALAEHFLREANRENDRSVRAIDRRAMAALEAFRWPGNVRELRNVVERAVVIARGDVITLDDLPERLRGEGAKASVPPPSDDASNDGAGDYKERLKKKIEAFEIDVIVEALRRANGNQTEAAKALRMPVRTLAHKIATYGIKKTFDRK